MFIYIVSTRHLADPVPSLTLCSWVRPLIRTCSFLSRILNSGRNQASKVSRFENAIYRFVISAISGISMYLVLVVRSSDSSEIEIYGVYLSVCGSFSICDIQDDQLRGKMLLNSSKCFNLRKCLEDSPYSNSVDLNGKAIVKWIVTQDPESLEPGHGESTLRHYLKFAIGSAFFETWLSSNDLVYHLVAGGRSKDSTGSAVSELVLLLSLSRPLVAGNADLQAVDQIATASQNAAQTAGKPGERDVRDQLITSIIDTTVHYENSNGFLPMQSSSTEPPDLLGRHEVKSNFTLTNSLNDHDNSSEVDTEEEESLEQETEEVAEDDPAYSTEARIFLNFAQLRNNRRSFEYQSGQNDFELLKVKNNTPVVASYPNSYEDPPGSIESDRTQLSNHRIKGKSKMVEQYTGTYGITLPANHNDGSSYGDYYSHDAGKDKAESSHEQEKVTSNYHQQGVLSYNSHGQTVGPTSSLPRTNQDVNDLAHTASKNYDGMYDSVAMSSQVAQNQHRFTRPVVVADPNYQFDHSRLSNSGSTDYQTSRIIDSGSSEVSHRYSMNSRNGRFRSEEDSRDMSDETDYVEYSDKPRRVQKSRRRPSNFDSSRRLPKEHRGSLDDSSEYESYSKRHHSRGKSNRQRVKGNSWVDDDQEDSYEEPRYDDRFSGSETRPKSQHNSKFKPNNSWKQVSPNLEISHSSGVEIGQLEKPKLIVPVNVNLVPVGNFDHATAIGNSQGFDMSNVLLPVSTPTPLLTTPESAMGQDTKIKVSSPVPDIIMGHNSFQNTIQAVMPQGNDQSKFSTNLKPQYVSSTIAPIYAVTPHINSGLQGIPIQEVQGTTSRPNFANQMQQVQGNIPQLIVPQPTVQTVPTLLQSPFHSNFNIQVNPHGMHGQNFVNPGNLQVQSMPTMSTVTPTPQTIPVTKFNLVTAESQGKKTLLPASTANFLASASLTVGQNDQRQSMSGNSFYLQNSNPQQMVKPQVQGGVYQQIAPKTKTYIQTTHLLPAVLHPMPTLATFAASTPQVISEPFVKIPVSGFDAASTLKSIRVPAVGYQTVDNIGSQSTATINTLSPFQGVSGMADNAHLPYVGTKNVEIVNPNIKPSPVDATVVNAYESMQYPAAVLTTPIPMFTTTSVVTTRPYLSTSTESTGDMKAFQSQDRPMFNPINFVPNMDVVKNQNVLNSKLNNEPLQGNLNLVPLIPGGNFFRPSYSAQSELLVKPKLSSDLENYAEQMFKESLKTIYNSQKWNNDRKPGTRHNSSETLDLTKLKNELQRLKASLSDSKRNKDQIEGHHSETKVHTAELPSKKPDELLAALEQMLKTHSSDSSHSYQGNSRPHRQRRPGDHEKFKFSATSDFRDTKHFMKHPHSHRPKGHFYDKPGKKRPISGPPRYKNHNHFHGPRSHHKHTLSPKLGGLEVSATNSEPALSDSPRFEALQDSKHHSYSEFRKPASFGSYPSFTTSSPEGNSFLQAPKLSQGGREQDFNHPKIHNYLGLLMKNKQLPTRSTPLNYFQDKAQVQQYFEDEKQRAQQQFYDNNLKNYLYKISEGTLYSNLGHSGSDARRPLTDKRGI
ncbi:uncharacterized protein LOC143181387 [Calliopsis andreniformis]|uniref:uncharacterized protein LOC143181387 n=1 Tax=Calliopsis andreniformis TaxID=337506 RepID=UPI003FCC2E37